MNRNASIILSLILTIYPYTRTTHIFDAVSSPDDDLREHLVTILPQLLPAPGVKLPEGGDYHNLV